MDMKENDGFRGAMKGHWDKHNLFSSIISSTIAINFHSIDISYFGIRQESELLESSGEFKTDRRWIHGILPSITISHFEGQGDWFNMDPSYHTTKQTISEVLDILSSPQKRFILQSLTLPVTDESFSHPSGAIGGRRIVDNHKVRSCCFVLVHFSS